MAKMKNNKQILFEETEDNIIKQHLGKTIEENQLVYSDLVITGRALPSLYDGLKPVHRRILYTFKNENYIGSKKRKSALIVGAVIGKFHPHGDLAVYGALVEMSQVFKNRFPLTHTQGNFGNIQGDSMAAMRYTEITVEQDMANILFTNIEKDGVIPWGKNYDDELDEPEILPTKYPIALLNGTMGIAYAGITTKIPSYNIRDLTNFYIYMIDNKFWKDSFNVEEHKSNILNIIPSVDLPTGTNIYFDGEDSKQEDMIFSSQFSFRMRANYEIDYKNNLIIFKNIPIDVLTDRLVEEIKNAGLSYKLDKKKKQIPKDASEILNIAENADVQGISSYKDKDYINDAELTLTFKKGSNLDLELIKVFKYTSLDSSYSAKMRFIDKDTCPVLVSLYEQTREFLKFRLHTFFKAFQFDINKLEMQLHLLKGLMIIHSDLDKFIEIVKRNEDNILYELIKKDFDLDDVQIEYLLNIQLRKISKTSIEKVADEIKEKTEKVRILKEKISTKDKLYQVVKEDYEEQLTKSYMKNKKSKRITKIIKAQKNINKEDLIQDKEVIIMYMEDDSIAYVDKNKFKLKNKGTKTTNTKINNDFELNLKISEACNFKDTLLLMTNKGKVFKIKAFTFTEDMRYIGNLLGKQFEKDEKLVRIVVYKDEYKYYSITTKLGKAKGVSKLLFKNTTSNRAIKSITLKDNDEVISFEPYQKEENEKIIILTNQGRVIKYDTGQIPVISGTGQGNKACVLSNKEVIIKASIFVETNETVFIGISDTGKGKKTLTNKISDKKRTNAPNLFFNNSKENGNIVCGEIFDDVENDILMILTEKADVSLIKINGFNSVSRATKGSVILIRMEGDEKVKICKKLKIKHLSEAQSQILQVPNKEDEE